MSSILSPLASRRAVATPVMSQPEPPRTQLRKSGLQTVHLHNSDLSADTPSSETSSFTDQSQTVAHQLPLMQPGTRRFKQLVGTRLMSSQPGGFAFSSKTDNSIEQAQKESVASEVALLR